MNESIEQLKKLAESRVKSYHTAVPEDQIISINQFLISYVREETAVGIQNTLAVSHCNGEEFRMETIQFVFDQFPIALAFVFSQKFINRGFTYMFVWKAERKP